MSMNRTPLLVVEGKTDVHLFVHLLKKSGFFAHIQQPQQRPQPPKGKTWEDVDVLVSQPENDDSNTGGKNKLLADIHERILTPGPVAIGFVLDADSPEFGGMGLVKSWQAVRDQLTRSDTRWKDTLPAVLPSQGFRGQLENFGTRVGVWIMPDNEQDGTVEHFIESLVAQGASLWGHAEQSTDDAKDQYGALFADKDRKKAILQAWLAWQVTPGMRFEEAFRTGVLKHDASSAIQFVDWVRWLIDGSVSEGEFSS